MSYVFSAQNLVFLTGANYINLPRIVKGRYVIDGVYIVNLLLQRLKVLTTNTKPAFADSR